MIGLDLFFLLILLCLLMYLVIRKSKDIHRNNRKTVLKNKLNPLLQKHLLEDEDFQTRILQKNPIFHEVLEELLNNYNKIMNSQNTKIKIQEIADSYLTEYYKTRFIHPRWSIRMNTLYQIEGFHLSSFQPVLWNRYENIKPNNEVEAIQIIKTLASLENPQLIEFLLRSHPSFSKVEYKEILRKLGVTHLNLFINRFSELQEPLKIAIIEYIGENNEIGHLSFIEEQLNTDSFEVHLSALKVLSSFGVISNFNKVLLCFQSSHWEERMFFAKLCGTLKKERSKTLLIQLMSDDNWFVRNAAGQALAQFEDGLFILRHIHESNSDPYARDMALQWLESGEIN